MNCVSLPGRIIKNSCVSFRFLGKQTLKEIQNSIYSRHKVLQDVTNRSSERCFP